MDKNALIMTALRTVMAEYAAGNSPIKKYENVIAKMDKIAMTNPNAFRSFGLSYHHWQQTAC